MKKTEKKYINQLGEFVKNKVKFYELDATIQSYVIRNSGIDLNDVSLVHINNQYVFDKGNLSEGSYFYKLNNGDESIKTGKFFIAY